MRHRLAQRRVLCVVDRLLGQADRDRRTGGQSCPAASSVASSSSDSLDAAVNQAPVGCLRGASPFRRAAASVLARASPASRGSSQVDPESGLKPRATNGSQKTASVDGHREVGGQGQIAPEADGVTAHAAHDRQVNGVRPVR